MYTFGYRILLLYMVDNNKNVIIFYHFFNTNIIQSTGGYYALTMSVVLLLRLNRQSDDNALVYLKPVYEIFMQCASTLYACYHNSYNSCEIYSINQISTLTSKNNNRAAVATTSECVIVRTEGKKFFYILFVSKKKTWIKTRIYWVKHGILVLHIVHFKPIQPFFE